MSKSRPQTDFQEPFFLKLETGSLANCLWVLVVIVVLVEIGFHHVVQAGLELLASGDPPASVS